MSALPEAKLSKPEVRYENPAQMPSHNCAVCGHFVHPDGCLLVAGDIDPDAWCELWEKPQGVWTPKLIKYSEDQPRDDHGRFGSGGSGGSSRGTGGPGRGTSGAGSRPGEGGRLRARTSGHVTGGALHLLQRQAAGKISHAPVPTQAEIAHNHELLQHSKRAGGELRGNNTDRARRTQGLLKEFGNGRTCGCVYCGAVLDKTSLTQDKIYTVEQGGRYRMSNLLPACYDCNHDRGATPIHSMSLASAKIWMPQVIKEFDPALHPRGEDGRFGDTGAGRTKNERALTRLHNVDKISSRLIRQGQSTRNLNRSPRNPDKYSSTRWRQHQAIIREILRENSHVPRGRVAVIMGGLPGSGKTYTLDHMPRDTGNLLHGLGRTQFLTINPDDMKQKMIDHGMVPDYKGLKPMEAAGLMHTESSGLARELLYAAQARGMNVIIDGTMGDRGSALEKADGLRAAGYKIHGIYVDVPDATSKQFVIERFARAMGTAQGGRSVDPSYLKMLDRGARFPNKNNFESIKSTFSEWALMTNSREEGPKIVARGP